MLTEYLIPEAFRGSMWFNLVIFQLYISIFMSILYFGKELIVFSIEHILNSAFTLISELWSSITVCLTRIVQLPINLIESIVTQHFPVKGDRLNILNLIKEETEDNYLYNLINNGLVEARVPSDIRRLEKSIIQYTESRQYIYDNSEGETQDNKTHLTTIECM